MPVFVYLAKNEDDTIVRGTIAGDSPRQARELIRERGMRILEIREDSASKDPSSWMSLLGRNPAQQVASMAGELSTLLAVGVPLLDALDTLTSQYRGRMRNILLHLKDQVAAGKNLADAMGQQPQVFDRLSLKMVEVGENTGNLDAVLHQLSEFKRKSSRFKDRILTALLYPIIVLSVSIAVTIFLMTVVVPMLLENLIEADRPLPWPTAVLKMGSDLLVTHGWWLAMVAAGGLVGAIGFFRTDAGARWWYSAIMRLPVIGAMSQKQEIARVSLILATLMRSGVEFLEAVEIAKGTSPNPLLRDALDECAQQIRSGKDIGTALKRSQFFPPMVIQVYTIGQQSGQLDKMLLRLASDFDEQVEAVAARLSTAVEPVLILILSIFVGFILFATLLPILEAGNVL